MERCKKIVYVKMLLISAVFVLCSCEPPPPEPAETTHVIEIPQGIELTDPVQTSEETPPEVDPSETESPVPDQAEPEIQPETQGPDLAEPVLPQEIPDEPVVEEYVPTEVEYDEIFSEVELLIQSLNEIIRQQRFDEWLSFLTPRYAERISDPEFLLEVSERPIMKNRGIELQTLEDYFTHVVVPSRANLRLDELNFLNNQEVEAIMVMGNTRITLYSLILIDGAWKIGSF